MSNVTSGQPFGGVLIVVNFTAPDPATGDRKALASIRVLNPCGSGSARLAQVCMWVICGLSVGYLCLVCVRVCVCVCMRACV